MDKAVDYEIKECEFWDMTYAEIERAIKSKIKLKKIEAQEKASYDYMQAQLIVKGISKILSGKGDYPTLEEAYPGLFDDVVEARKQEAQQQKINLSALRFKQFAQSYNSNFKKKEEVAKDK